MLKVWYHMFARTYLHLSLRPNSVTTGSNTNGWGMNDAGMGAWGGDKDTSLADLGDNGKLGDTGTAPTKFSSLNDTLFDTGSNYDNGAATEAGFYGVGGYGGRNEMETQNAITNEYRLEAWSDGINPMGSLIIRRPRRSKFGARMSPPSVPHAVYRQLRTAIGIVL